MDLRVLLDRTGEHTSHCFAALPSAVSNVLLGTEGRTLVVLALRQVGTKQGDGTAYVSWNGASSTRGDVLALGKAFGDALGLADGEPVQVLAVNHEGLKAGRVTLRCESDDDYTCFVAAASTLEEQLLNQIRVIFRSQRFPITLPGRSKAFVRVDDFSVEGSASPEFAVLESDVQVSVVPPSEVGRGPSLDTRYSRKLKAIQKTTACSTRCASQLAVQKPFPPINGPQCRVVRVIVHAQGRPRYTQSLLAGMRFVPDDECPEGCVMVPPNLWAALGLSPLAPVLLEEMSDGIVENIRYKSAPVLRCLFATEKANTVAMSSAIESNLHEIRATLDEPSLVYPGMLLGGGVVGTHRQEDDRNVLRHAMATFRGTSRTTGSWDRDSNELEAPGADENEAPYVYEHEPILLESNFAIEVVSCEHVHEAYGLERHIQTLDVRAESSRASLRCASIIRLARETVHHLAIGDLQDAKTGAEKPNAKPDIAPRLVLIRGAPGCGKTTLVRAIAETLREEQLVRTLWIRGRAHAQNDTSTRLAKLASALREAELEGPALVVIDDFDSFAPIPAEGSFDANRETSDDAAAAHEIALSIAQFVASGTRKTCRGIVLCAEQDALVDEELNVPGVITLAISFPLLSDADRAILLKHFVERLARGRLMGPDVSLRDMAPGICSAAQHADSCIARDLETICRKATACSSTVDELATNLVAFTRSHVPVGQLGIAVERRNADEGPRSWDSIGGLSSAKETLREVLSLPSRYPTVFAAAPVRLQSGVLLYGPPGCGKTDLAHVAASACGMRALTIKGPELLGKYVGESEAAVRSLFSRAAAVAPCAIIFDEFDALAPRRGGETTGVADRVVNTLLTSLDGVESRRRDVFIIATSSRPELIDPALLRPGRIDKWVPIGFPSETERAEILTATLAGIGIRCDPRQETVLQEISKTTSGLTGADLRGLVLDAHFSAAAQDESSTAARDVFQAMLTLAQSVRPSVSVSERERYRSVMEYFGGSSRQDDGGSAPGPEVLDPVQSPSRMRVALQ